MCRDDPSLDSLDLSDRKLMAARGGKQKNSCVANVDDAPETEWQY